MNLFKKYKERVKSVFTKKPDYKAMYEAERRVAESWEFKYNKLYRQLNAIIKESK